MWQTGLVRLSSLVMQGTSEEPMPGYSYDPAAFAGWIWNRTRAHRITRARIQLPSPGLHLPQHVPHPEGE